MTHLNTFLETTHFTIKPLNAQELVYYRINDGRLEHALGIPYYPRIVPFELADALEQEIIPSVETNPDYYLYYTLWTIYHKEYDSLVGDICFKGPADENGQIEIGYGTYSDFQGKGIMKEALKLVINWAFEQPKVCRIMAETEHDNIASHKVLLANHFKPVENLYTTLWYRDKL